MTILIMTFYIWLRNKLVNNDNMKNWNERMTAKDKFDERKLNHTVTKKLMDVFKVC